MVIRGIRIPPKINIKGSVDNIVETVSSSANSASKPLINIKSVSKPNKITIKTPAQQTFEDGIGANILAEQNRAVIVQEGQTPTFNIGTRTIDNNPYHKLLGEGPLQNIGEAQRLFARETNGTLALHCPTNMGLLFNENSGFGGFDASLELLEAWYKQGLLKDFERYNVKHVLVGHGTGSSVQGTWKFVDNNKLIMDYIKQHPDMKEGERVLVLCCEQAPSTYRQGTCIGREVDLSLCLSKAEAAKIVVVKEGKIIGGFFNPAEVDGGVKIYDIV